MKNKSKKALVFIGIALALVSCEKTDYFSDSWNTESIRMISDRISISCSVDNGFHTSFVYDDTQEFEGLIYNLLSLSCQGHSIEIWNTSIYQNCGTKETIVREFKTREDAGAWVQIMVEEGYKVRIDYDANTGIYTCTATR